MTEPVKKIYPSSAGWMLGPLVAADSNSQCHRYMWAVANGNAPRIDSVAKGYTAIGNLSEERLAATFRRRRLKFIRGSRFKVEFKGAVISGELDFLFETPEGPMILEAKASTSSHVLKDVIQGGAPKDAHMAQLTTYLSLQKIPDGQLHYTYYVLSPDQKSFVALAERLFIVKVLDNAITVDGQPYKYSVRDLARWIAGAEAALTAVDKIPNEPIRSMIAYKDACHFCPLKETCASHKDQNLDPAQFLLKATEALSAPREIREFHITTMRKEKNGPQDD